MTEKDRNASPVLFYARKLKNEENEENEDFLLPVSQHIFLHLKNCNKINKLHQLSQTENCNKINYLEKTLTLSLTYLVIILGTFY